MVYSLSNGGAERVACSWANGLVRLGHKVSILTNLKDKSYLVDERINLIQCKSILLGKTSLFAKVIRSIINPFILFYQLLHIYKIKNIDTVINVLYIRPYTLLISRLFSRRNFPIIMTDHNVYERPKEDKFSWRVWRNKFFDNKFFDIVTVLTKRDKEILDKKNFSNIEVLYNPLFLTPVSKVPIKNNAILAVGRIDVWRIKGFDLLIRAWDKISYKYPDWKLKIVGKGSTDSIRYLKSLITNCQNAIEFCPFNNDIVKEYQDASVFVLSSRYEGWGLVMIEAMSQGCAVIACDYKGRQSEAITDGENGLICETDNVEALANKISMLIDDTKLRTTLQEHAIKSVDFYHEDKVAKRLEKIILDCIKND